MNPPAAKGCNRWPDALREKLASTIVTPLRISPTKIPPNLVRRLHYNRSHMKSGVLIAVAVCIAASTAHASPTLVEQAAARGRARDHAGAIDLYRKAYEAESNSAILVWIAHEYKRVGNTREALAYFCSYMYVDAAGMLADEASLNARSLAAQMGNPTQSDHDACSQRPAASRTAEKTPTVDMVEIVHRPPPRITKREVVGLATLGGSVAALGLALLEAQRIARIQTELATDDPGLDIDSLHAREDSAAFRQKMFLISGGVAMITGGILYVTGRNDRKRQERAYVAPSLLKNGAGVVMGRRF